MEVGREKVCCACGRLLSVADFQGSAYSADGFLSRCRRCQREYHGEWSKENRQRVKGYRERSREKGKRGRGKDGSLADMRRACDLWLKGRGDQG